MRYPAELAGTLFLENSDIILGVANCDDFEFIYR